MYMIFYFEDFDLGQLQKNIPLKNGIFRKVKENF